MITLTQKQKEQLAKELTELANQYIKDIEFGELDNTLQEAVCTGAATYEHEIVTKIFGIPHEEFEALAEKHR